MSWEAGGGAGWVANDGEEIGLSGSFEGGGTVKTEGAGLAGVGRAEIECVDGGYVGVFANDTLLGVVGLGAGGDVVLSPDCGVYTDGGDGGGKERKREESELHFESVGRDLKLGSLELGSKVRFGSWFGSC